jgi:hypothetical protein
MFDFLFASSRKKKTEALKAIIENISDDVYTKSLYIASLELLTDNEFENFYEMITGKIQESKEPSIVQIQPLKLPWINSL